MEVDMADVTPMAMCPMAETCKGMMEKPRFGFMFMVPGIIFIILGVAVLIEPQILVWLVAIALIFIGIAMTMMAMFMRKIGERFNM
jgi:uncharacterized membrane protein HdeD (DUF308 family)